MGFLTEVARGEADLLGQSDCSQDSHHDLFEEASRCMKVLLNCYMEFPWEELPPVTDHNRNIKEHLEIGSDLSTQHALGWGSPTWVAPFL